MHFTTQIWTIIMRLQKKIRNISEAYVNHTVKNKTRIDFKSCDINDSLRRIIQMLSWRWQGPILLRGLLSGMAWSEKLYYGWFLSILLFYKVVSRFTSLNTLESQIVIILFHSHRIANNCYISSHPIAFFEPTEFHFPQWNIPTGIVSPWNYRYDPFTYSLIEIVSWPSSQVKLSCSSINNWGNTKTREEVFNQVKYWTCTISNIFI